MIFLKFIYLLILYAVQVESSTKKLLENPGFDSPLAWISGNMPCALDKVVFPEAYAAVLPLPMQVEVTGFILPYDGAILLDLDGTIELGANLKPGQYCDKSMEGKAYLKTAQVRKWYEPDSWSLITSKTSSISTALPHLQQVPCDNDAVLITRKGPLAIDLEFAQYLRVAQLNLAGTLLTKEYLEELLTTDLGQLLFHNNNNVRVEYYRNDICGCHKDFKEFAENVCHNVQPKCPQPHCLMPVLPFGSCCSICGAVLSYSVARCDNVMLQQVQNYITKSLAKQQLSQKVDVDVSFYSSTGFGKYLQLIVVDRNDYNELSSNFIKELNATAAWQKLLRNVNYESLQYSGRAYNPNVSVLSILLIILTAIIVVFLALILLGQYAPNNAILQHLPIWIYDPRHWRAFILRTQLVFARFDQQSLRAMNVSGVEDIHETVAVASDNLAMVYNAETGTLHEGCFDNPMFGTKVSTEVVPTKEPQLLETGSLDTVQQLEAAQELTEIKLNSSSSDENTDIEIETKE